MIFDFRSSPLRLAGALDFVTSSITIPPAQGITPSGNGIVDVQSREGGDMPQKVFIQPISVGADDDTYTLAVYGWHRSNGRGARPGWFPVTLGSFACTAGAKTGVDGTDIDSTHFFADTITLTANYGTANVTNQIISPANDEYASIVLDTRGCPILDFRMAIGTTPTAMNALIAFM